LAVCQGGTTVKVIPIVGGLLFVGLVYVWLTSALWFFQTNGITF
jgi:hypothetical protein